MPDPDKTPSDSSLKTALQTNANIISHHPDASQQPVVILQGSNDRLMPPKQTSRFWQTASPTCWDQKESNEVLKISISTEIEHKTSRAAPTDAFRHTGCPSNGEPAEAAPDPLCNYPTSGPTAPLSMSILSPAVRDFGVEATASSRICRDGPKREPRAWIDDLQAPNPTSWFAAKDEILFCFASFEDRSTRKLRLWENITPRIRGRVTSLNVDDNNSLPDFWTSWAECWGFDIKGKLGAAPEKKSRVESKIAIPKADSDRTGTCKVPFSDSNTR